MYNTVLYMQISRGKEKLFDRESYHYCSYLHVINSRTHIIDFNSRTQDNEWI